MDRLAACHLSYGFLHVPGRRSGRRHASSPNCQNLKTASRSLSLADRRGLISPGHFNGRGLISPAFSSDQRYYGGSSTRREHQSRISISEKFRSDDESIRKLHDMRVAMEAVESRFGGGRGGGGAPLNTFGGIFLPFNLPVPIDTTSRGRVESARPSTYRRGGVQERNGEVMLTLRYCTRSRTLHVTVLKARDLPRRAADTYVRLRLLHRGSELEQRVSSSRAQNANPTYNEWFSFTLPGHMQLGGSEMNLIVSLMAYDLINGDLELGHTIIGPLGTHTGARHLKEVIRSPELDSTLWHRLSSR